MTNLIQIINTICSGENSRSRPPLRYRSVLVALAFALFVLSPAVRAVDPPPDGGYPGDNTAEGENALFSLTSGIHNTATGYETLFLNTTGFNNTAIGWEAMNDNTIGTKNTAVGCDALDANTTGSNNTAAGVLALLQNTTGNGNIAFGFGAGQNLTTGSNNIDIGNRGVSGESNTIRIGAPGAQANTFIAGIRGATVADGITTLSSERYKEAVQPMDKSSDAILALQPVTFRYKKELDPAGIPQFGLVAEQVAKVKPDLVVRDDEGRPETVRYEVVNAMLLNEFLKEHRKVETQEKKVQQLETTVTRLEAALKEQAAQIQAVNEKVELGKSAPRMVTND